MKSIYFRTLLVTLFVALHEVSGQECQPEEHAAHPYFCNRFLACSNGVFVEMFCPSGLYFNPDVGVCDWPGNVNCSPSSVTPPSWNSTTPSGNITTPTPPNWNITTSSPPNWNITTPDLNITTPNWNITTPNWNITTPDWNNTTPNWNNTTPNWNITTPDLNVTSPNWNITTTSPPNWNITTPNWNTTTSNSTFSIPVNPTGTTPNITSSTATPSESKCSDSNQPATLPHPNCNYFYKCSYGYTYEIKCQDGLVWNQIHEYCDYPENANCVNGLAPIQ